VVRLKGNSHVRQFRCEHSSEALAERADSEWRIRLELHRKPTFLGAAIPKVNEIDGIIRGMNADQAHRQRDIVRADFAFDKVKDLESDLFRVLDFCPGRGAQANGQLTGIDIWKNFNSELFAHA